MQYYLNVWKNYANFEGRARRSEYWYFFLFNTIIVFGLSFLMVLVSEDLAIFYYLYVLLAILPGWAVGVRRMHRYAVGQKACRFPRIVFQQKAVWI